MTKEPVVSVILCCYNQEKYVRQAIESVLGQTYKSIELLLIDNGSTDGSAAIMKEYGTHPGVKLTLHAQNDRVTRRYNAAIAESTGEFISILYADDYYLPRKTEWQVGCFEKLGLEYGVVYAPCYRLNDVTKESWVMPSMKTSGQLLRTMLLDYYKTGFMNPISPLVRRRCHLDYPYREEAFFEGEGIFIRMAASYRFHFFEQPVSVMIDHPDNLGKAYRHSQRNEVTLMDCLSKDPNFPEEYRGMLAVFRSRVMRNYGWLAIRLAGDAEWARECFGIAVRLYPLQALHPRTVVGIILSLVPPSLLKRLNHWVHRLRQPKGLLEVKETA